MHTLFTIQYTYRSLTQKKQLEALLKFPTTKAPAITWPQLPSANGGCTRRTSLGSLPKYQRDPGVAEVMSPLSLQSLGIDLDGSHGYSI